MTLFRGRFRVESARLPGGDYHSPGWYFVTICTRNRIHYFGSVINRQMVLSPIGKIARFELLKTPEIRNNVIIDEWAIMPDHIHVIFRILPTGITGNADVNADVETHPGASLPHVPPDNGCEPCDQPYGGIKNQFGPQSNNLPAIVRGFKSMVKRWTNLYCMVFHWQSRYHERIIRDKAALDRIRHYIINNVAAWDCNSQNQ
jgi:REP element-mobilizing transposase RayT